MKRCSACGRTDKRFYKEPKNKDGLRGRCTDCEYLRSREYASTETGFLKMRAARQRPDQRERLYAANARWRASRGASYSKEYYKRTIARRKAFSFVKYQIKLGKLAAPTRCQRGGCHAQKNLVARIVSVSDPLVGLKFWCRGCAGLVDGLLRRGVEPQEAALAVSPEEWTAIHLRHLAEADHEYGPSDEGYAREVAMYRERFRKSLNEEARRPRLEPRFADRMLLQAIGGWE